MARCTLLTTYLTYLPNLAHFDVLVAVATVIILIAKKVNDLLAVTLVRASQLSTAAIRFYGFFRHWLCVFRHLDKDRYFHQPIHRALYIERTSLDKRTMRVMYYLSLLALLVVAFASAEESTKTESAAADDATPPKEEEAAPVKPASKFGDFDPTEHTDWGSYYDPKNEFCGRFDCYKILGFDYESFGKEHPDKKIITQRYRSLSREWHPDKSKHKNAKNRFVVRFC
jgi:hypothetical protein